MKLHLVLAIALAIALFAKPLAAQQVTAVATPATPNENTKLGIGDKITFRVLEDPNPKGANWMTNMVGATGEMEFAIAEGSRTKIAMKVIDRTLMEIKEELKKKLEDDYYVKATLEMTLITRGQKAGGKIVIFMDEKAINRTLNPDESLTLFDAVFEAQPSPFAKLSKVRVIRKGVPMKDTINLQKMKDDGNRIGNIILQDGDQINVGDKKLFFN